MDQIDSDRRSRSEHRSSGKWWKKKNECFDLLYTNDNEKKDHLALNYCNILFKGVCFDFNLLSRMNK